MALKNNFDKNNRYYRFFIIQVVDQINSASKLQQLVFTKHFSAVTFKLQLPNLSTKQGLN